jgi:putative FmdB family regulatory protein
MPHYEFFCLDCQKFFYKILSVNDNEKGEIICPYCESNNIEHCHPTISSGIAERSA